MGFSGSYRVGQVLRHVWVPKIQPPGTDDETFLVRDVIDQLRVLFLNHGIRSTTGGTDSMDGPFLLGYHGRLYKIDTDFQVGWNRDGFNACGSGARPALGALHVLCKLPGTVEPKQMIRMALDAAEHLDTAVRGPMQCILGPWNPVVEVKT